METINPILFSSLVLAAVIWIGKLIIQKTFDVGINTYQIALNKLQLEHQVKFSSLHESQRLFLQEMYKELYGLEKVLKILTTTAQGFDWLSDDKSITAKNQLDKCFDLLEINMIFFEDKFCIELDNFLDECREAITAMDLIKVKAKSRNEDFKMSNNSEIDSPLQEWISLSRNVQSDLTTLRKEIAEKFRLLLS